MKQYYLLALLSMICYLSNAQPIEVGYDAAGNRILRKLNPMPVTLISFEAKKQTGNQELPTALLYWKTASETNSDHFDIQRSSDGKKWFEIGSVQASGDKASDTNYSFRDETPMDGENIYRLKMVDRDGTFAYSSLQSLKFESLTIFYPNPVKDRLRIKGLSAFEAKQSRVQIWDDKGQLVRELTGVPEEGINLALLPTGIYTISIARINGLPTIKKVIKE